MYFQLIFQSIKSLVKYNYFLYLSVYSIYIYIICIESFVFIALKDLSRFVLLESNTLVINWHKDNISLLQNCPRYQNVRNNLPNYSLVKYIHSTKMTLYWEIISKLQVLLIPAVLISHVCNIVLANKHMQILQKPFRLNTKYIFFLLSSGFKF